MYIFDKSRVDCPLGVGPNWEQLVHFAPFFHGMKGGGVVVKADEPPYKEGSMAYTASGAERIWSNPANDMSKSPILRAWSTSTTA